MKDLQEYKWLGYISSVDQCRVDLVNKTPKPKDDKVVVFRDFFRTGLRFPCHPMVPEILEKFEVSLHQLTPNAIARIAVYIWMVLSQGVQPTSAAFCHAHELHYRKKDKDCDGVLRHNNFGCYNFKYRKDAHGPCTASVSKWPIGWTEYWFYHKFASMVMSPLRISFGLPRPMMPSSSPENIQARVAFETMAAHISTRCLVEEYMAVGRVPCSTGFLVLKGPGVVAPNGLVTLPFQFKASSKFKMPLEEREVVRNFVPKEDKELKARFGDRQRRRLN